MTKKKINEVSKWMSIFTLSPKVKLLDDYRVDRVKKYSRWFKVSFFVKL